MLSTTTDTPQASLTDTVMDAYLDWREHAVAVEQAYQRWTAAGSADRQAAHGAYSAALDWEAAAAARLKTLLDAAIGELAAARAESLQ
jgi:hypothetical protein